MPRYSLRFFAIVILALAAGLVALRESGATDILRAQLADAQDARGQRERLLAERSRLRALQPQQDELPVLLGTRDEAARLRASISAMEKKLARADLESPQPVQRVAAPAQPMPPAPATWTNSGKATPTHTLHSVLWAGTQGDVETLRSFLELPDAVRVRAETLLQRLPLAARAQYRDAEHLVATLAATQIPTDLTTVTVKTEREEERADRKMLLVEGERTDGRKTHVSLRFRAGPDGWRLVIPETLLEKFERATAQPPK